jgi:hypothetical protein
MLRASADRLLIIGFVLALAIPGFLALLPNTVPDLWREGRPAMPFPKWLKLNQWKLFPLLFEQFFNDRIGGREQMLQALTAVKFDTLGVSPARTVVVGRYPWLFLTAPSVFADLHPPTVEQQADAWVSEFLARQRWLAERGMAYLVVIAPDKQTIYPEHLPQHCEGAPERRLYPLVHAGLRQAEVPTVDLRPGLHALKASRPVYRTLDTHWSPRGAVVGYAEIVTALRQWFPTMPPFVAEQIDDKVVAFADADLGRIVGLCPARQCERTLSFDRPQMSEVRESAPEWTGPNCLPHLPIQAWRSAVGPKVLFCHDSFGAGVVEAVAGHCGRLVTVPTYGLPTQLIQAEQPQVVVQLLVERQLGRPIPPRGGGESGEKTVGILRPECQRQN